MRKPWTAGFTGKLGCEFFQHRMGERRKQRSEARGASPALGDGLDSARRAPGLADAGFDALAVFVAAGGRGVQVYKEVAMQQGEEGKDGTEYAALNLGKTSRSTYIYRIVPKDRLYELFRNRENVLVQPSRWEDPFENFILKSPVETASGETRDFSFHDDFYGQCWTLHQAWDAMWRIYSPNKKAVRIRTTIERLARSLSARLAEGRMCSVSSAKWTTCPRESSRILRKPFSKTVRARMREHDLLVKRRAFRHEREVRLLYREKEKTKHSNGLYRFAVDPHALIDQIMIDPRLSKSEAGTFREEIKRKTGFQGKIKRSLLYAPPQGFVTRIP